MKKLMTRNGLLTLIVVILFMGMIPQGAIGEINVLPDPSKIHTSSLAETINDIFNSVETDNYIIDALFTGTDSNYYFQSIDTDDPRKLFNIIYLASYLNITIDDDIIKTVLDTFPANNYSLPLVYDDDEFFYTQQFKYLSLLGYAKRLNYLTDKWNVNNAIKGLIKCHHYEDRAFFSCNPNNNTVHNIFGTRWLTTGNLANAMLLLYNISNDTRALEYALKEWEFLNEIHWNEEIQAYSYSPEWKIWEWSTIEIFYSFDGISNTLDNYDRVYRDIENRYLQSQWRSPLWRNGFILHSDNSDQKRTHGTLDAYQLIYSYYQNLSRNFQLNLKNMIEGTDQIPPAWQQILENDDMYNFNTHHFKMDSDKDFSNIGTLEGAKLLFLLGLSIQDGGGINIPKISHGYSGGFFPVDVFRFLYDAREIVIPVYEDTSIKFLYGDQHPEYYFETAGLYRISFTEDWNAIKNVTEVHKNELLEPNANNTGLNQVENEIHLTRYLIPILTSVLFLIPLIIKKKITY